MILRVLSFLGGRKLKLLLAAGGLLTTFALFGVGYVKGGSTAAQQCSERQAEGIIEGERIYEEVKRKTMGLPTSDLDRELSRWLREPTQDD